MIPNLQNEFLKTSNTDQREKICLTRGSISGLQYLDGDMSFSLEIKQEYNPNHFLYHDQFFDIVMDRDGIEEYQDDQNRMSEENNLFLKQKLSEISRASRNSRGGANLIFKLPQGKNSDQILQKWNDQQNENVNVQCQSFQDLINYSKRNSQGQNLRISTEGMVTNLDGSLEILMEWADQPIDQIQIQDMINKLSLCEPTFLIQKPDRLSLLPNQSQGCVCKRSKCLKLYCQCFQAGKMCREWCECHDCCNNEAENEQRLLAISQIKEKNWNSFKEDHIIEVGSQQEKRIVTKGCNCKRSKCLKKYCECYNNNLICGPYCNCENCLNFVVSKNQLLHEAEDKVQLDLELQSEEQYINPQKKFRL